MKPRMRRVRRVYDPSGAFVADTIVKSLLSGEIEGVLVSRKDHRDGSVEIIVDLPEVIADLETEY